MLSLNQECRSKIVPEHALVIYKSNNGSNKLVVQHPIVQQHTRKNKPQTFALGAARAVDTQYLADVINSAQNDGGQQNDILPANILVAHSRMIAWHIPASIRRVWFVSRAKNASFLAAIPSLVFKFNREGLFIAALNTNDRPTGTSAVFRAPLPNIYANTKLCVGNAVLPSEISLHGIPMCEAALFDSNFSVFHCVGWKKNGCSGNDFTSFKQLFKRQTKSGTPFPNDILLPITKNTTLGGWLNDKCD